MATGARASGENHRLRALRPNFGLNMQYQCRQVHIPTRLGIHHLHSEKVQQNDIEKCRGASQGRENLSQKCGHFPNLVTLRKSKKQCCIIADLFRPSDGTDEPKKMSGGTKEGKDGKMHGPHPVQRRRGKVNNVSRCRGDAGSQMASIILAAAAIFTGSLDSVPMRVARDLMALTTSIVNMIDLSFGFRSGELSDRMTETNLNERLLLPPNVQAPPTPGIPDLQQHCRWESCGSITIRIRQARIGRHPRRPNQLVQDPI